VIVRVPKLPAPVVHHRGCGRLAARGRRVGESARAGARCSGTAGSARRSRSSNGRGCRPSGADPRAAVRRPPDRARGLEARRSTSATSATAHEVDGAGIWITNYEMADRFDPAASGRSCWTSRDPQERRRQDHAAADRALADRAAPARVHRDAGAERRRRADQPRRVPRRDAPRRDARRLLRQRREGLAAEGPRRRADVPVDGDVGDGAAPPVRPRLPRRRLRPPAAAHRPEIVDADVDATGSCSRPTSAASAAARRCAGRRWPRASSARRARRRATSSGSSGAASTTRPRAVAADRRRRQRRGRVAAGREGEALEAFQDGESACSSPSRRSPGSA
jgi:hypothetical protein